MKWINVSHRLPDTYRRVMVVDIHGYTAVAQYVPTEKKFYEVDREVKAKWWGETVPTPKIHKPYALIVNSDK